MEAQAHTKFPHSTASAGDEQTLTSRPVVAVFLACTTAGASQPFNSTTKVAYTGTMNAKAAIIAANAEKGTDSACVYLALAHRVDAARDSRTQNPKSLP